MARPSPKIIIQHQVNDDTYIDVLESSGLWFLTYMNKPVSLRERFFSHVGLQVKYPRTGYTNQAHCRRLAEKLNEQFNTDRFACQAVENIIRR
jgi:hypothetical protein